jgi:hypothetical protein
LSELVVGETGTATRAIRRDAVILSEKTFVPDLLE